VHIDGNVGRVSREMRDSYAQVCFAQVHVLFAFQTAAPHAPESDGICGRQTVNVGR